MEPASSTTRRDLSTTLGTVERSFDVPIVSPPQRILDSGRATWLSLAVFGSIVVAHGMGIASDLTYPVVILGGVGCAVLGLRHHRPDVAWPWWALVATGVIWTASGVAADLAGTTGDLTTDRTLVPDLLALPGYLLFGAALHGLHRARRPDREADTLIDGIMLAVGAALVVHELVIAPAMELPDTWLMARLAVAMYPALAICLLVTASRLAFGRDRSVSFGLLLIGTAALVVGDVVYAFGQIGRFDAPTALLEVPYLVVPLCIGAAALHPSMRTVTLGGAAATTRLGPGRLLAVSAALFIPVLVLALHGAAHGRHATVVLSFVLTATAVARIVTAMRAQASSQAEIYHQATHDDLTGLPNRPLITLRIDELLAHPSTGSIALLFLDLDQFKFVNDSMGHGAGDTLLVQAADRIRRSVREQDIVGRMSGDEFVIVCAKLDAAGATALADRIRDSLRHPFDLDQGEVFVTASIGITVTSTPAPVGTAATLFQQADTAMYRSKDAGRDTTTIFDASMRDGIERRLELERALRHALDNRDLTVAFQPIVTAPGGTIQGFEALVRWNLGGTGISPAEFIPIAEDSGMIVPLGAFVLDESCRQLAWWRAHVPGGAELSVSVNMSARQVRAGDVVDTVAETLERHGLPAEALWLEITESVMMEDSIATIAAMAGIRALGVRLSVDDFGTGYSSLSYLKRFPVSRVKIDRSFVSGLGQHEADLSLVAAIVAMAQALDLEPIAEGVETAEQARILLQLGCTHMQGYLFGAPAPPHEIPGLLAISHGASRRSTVAARRCAKQAG